MNLTNLILNTDSYKFSHFLQYPPGTKGICAYIETRGHPDQADVVFFGLQMFLKEYLGKPVTSADVDEAEAVVVAHGLPFNRAGWMRIVDHFGGYLPLEIQALPEGTLLRRGVPMVQILNTDPESFWLTSYIETALLRAVWYPSSVASNARKIKQIIRPVLEKTCDDPEAALPFRLHDFGARGAGARWNRLASAGRRTWSISSAPTRSRAFVYARQVLRRRTWPGFPFRRPNIRP